MHSRLSTRRSRFASSASDAASARGHTRSLTCTHAHRITPTGAPRRSGSRSETARTRARNGTRLPICATSIPSPSETQRTRHGSGQSCCNSSNRLHLHRATDTRTHNNNCMDVARSILTQTHSLFLPFFPLLPSSLFPSLISDAEIRTRIPEPSRETGDRSRSRCACDRLCVMMIAKVCV